jgi:Ser/Thr protein kinase RdoA (MazF antagonist)
LLLLTAARPSMSTVLVLESGDARIAAAFASAGGNVRVRRFMRSGDADAGAWMGRFLARIHAIGRTRPALAVQSDY